MAKGKGHARWTMSLFRVFPEHPLVTSTPTYWPERHPSCEGPWRGSTSHWGRGSRMRSGFCYTDGAMTLNPPSPGLRRIFQGSALRQLPWRAMTTIPHHPCHLQQCSTVWQLHPLHVLLVTCLFIPPSAPRLPYSQLLAHNVNWRH